MYNDYPVIYESTVNQSISYGLVLIFIGIIMLVLILVSLAKIFKKANRKSISAFIPLYNLYVLVEITNLPKYYWLLLLIPGINIIFIIILTFSLAKMFKKGGLFALGLLLLPFIYYPILGFGDSEYVGINIVAMGEKEMLEKIPDIDLNKNNPIEVEVNDQKDEKTAGINISIGGGVYQKNYTSNLLNVADEKVLSNKNNEKVNFQEEFNQKFINSEVKNNQNTNISPQQPKKDIFTVDFIPTNNVKQAENNPIQNNEIKNKSINSDKPVINIEKENTIEDHTSSIPVNNNSDSSLEYKICPKCGAKVKINNNTCFICGNQF